MLCNGDNPILQITGVEYIRCEAGTYDVEPRGYSALSFRISGSTTFISGGNKYSVTANDVLYLPQNMAYTAEYEETEMITIHFITANDDSKMEVYSFKNSEAVYKKFLQAQMLWKSKEPGFNVYTTSLFYSILGAIQESETKANMPKYFLKAISYINSNYKDNSISVDGICAEVGIGATMFRQLFQKHYNKAPTEYITDLRLEYARNLISGGMSIKNAAYESGFNDPKYFARVVKKRFGCTPRELKGYGK